MVNIPISGSERIEKCIGFTMLYWPSLLGAPIYTKRKLFFSLKFIQFLVLLHNDYYEIFHMYFTVIKKKKQFSFKSIHFFYRQLNFKCKQH